MQIRLSDVRQGPLDARIENGVRVRVRVLARLPTGNAEAFILTREEADMGDYFKAWAKPGPRPLKVEVIDSVLWSVAAVWFGHHLNMTTSQIVLLVLAVNAGSTLRYVWWHFHPYKEPPRQPVTRYTKN